MMTPKPVLAAALSVVCATYTYAQNPSEQPVACDDNACYAEARGGQEPAGEVFAAVCPVGQSVVEPVEQAPRLETLEGKTVAVVGGSFMASVTHPEIKRLILQEYPSAKVYVLGEVGAAGVFPGPGIRRNSVERFQTRLKELGVDAVISGNGGCGLCTPKETGSSIAAEYMGIPSVTIAGPGFAEQAVLTAAHSGVLAARVARYPGAFAAHTEEELLKNTSEVLWPQIKEALLKPLARYEKRLARTEQAALTPCPEWYALPEGCEGGKLLTVPVMQPGMTALLVTGDRARNKVQTMPGGGCSTVEIVLPANWDELMREAGYEPLERFYIE